VIVATGVTYRRLEVPELERFDGVGLFYGAGLSQAKAIAGRPVVIVGGGNSAGQAAMHLAKYASHVELVVRSDSLAHSMSSYLIRELEAAPNIDVRFGTELVGADGDEQLEQVRLRDRPTGSTIAAEACAAFVLIGAEPGTAWLPSAVERDEWGYLVTGGRWLDDAAVTSDAALSSVFETSLPGVFAVGDVRQGSVKRVASAAGEGAICVRLVHEFLTSVPVPQQ
jgi:thioredoxin reductase (NADPH)